MFSLVQALITVWETLSERIIKKKIKKKMSGLHAFNCLICVHFRVAIVVASRHHDQLGTEKD